MLPPHLKQLVQITRGNEDTAGPLAQEEGTLGTRGDPWRKRTGPITQEDEAGGLFSPFHHFFLLLGMHQPSSPVSLRTFLGHLWRRLAAEAAGARSPGCNLGAGQREERGIQHRGSGEKKRWKDCQGWLCAASLHEQIGEETVKRWKLPAVRKEGAGSGVLLALSTPLVGSQTSTGFFCSVF